MVARPRKQRSEIIRLLRLLIRILAEPDEDKNRVIAGEADA